MTDETNTNDDCQHEDYEQIDTIWDDGEHVCWICQCLICGETFEQILTVMDEGNND